MASRQSPEENKKAKQNLGKARNQTQIPLIPTWAPSDRPAMCLKTRVIYISRTLVNEPSFSLNSQLSDVMKCFTAFDFSDVNYKGVDARGSQSLSFFYL